MDEYFEIVEEYLNKFGADSLDYEPQMRPWGTGDVEAITKKLARCIETGKPLPNEPGDPEIINKIVY